MPLVVEDVIQRLQVRWIWIEQGFDVLGLDADDRSVMATRLKPEAQTAHAGDLTEAAMHHPRHTRARLT